MARLSVATNQCVTLPSTYLHIAMSGPRIGFLQECLRWWDQYLKGINTGIADEPTLRAWIQHPARPASLYDERPGRWVAEPSWPGAGVSEYSFNLAPRQGE